MVPRKMLLSRQHFAIVSVPVCSSASALVGLVAWWLCQLLSILRQLECCFLVNCLNKIQRTGTRTALPSYCSLSLPLHLYLLLSIDFVVAAAALLLCCSWSNQTKSQRALFALLLIGFTISFFFFFLHLCVFVAGVRKCCTCC